jgi:hypothetical protein
MPFDSWAEPAIGLLTVLCGIVVAIVVIYVWFVRGPL